jgi:hypothetical protein
MARFPWRTQENATEALPLEIQGERIMSSRPRNELQDNLKGVAAPPGAKEPERRLMTTPPAKGTRRHVQKKQN